MNEIEITRTWTAQIRVYTYGHGVTVHNSSNSEYDLLRDQTVIAVHEASRFLSDGTEVSVDLYKTTKARGTEKDRTVLVVRGRKGEVRYI
jgi:hypothetical protein